MSDLFGNHIVGFPTRRLIYFIAGLPLMLIGLFQMVRCDCIMVNKAYVFHKSMENVESK